MQRHGLLGRFEVQQTIAKRKVQQFALPTFDAAFGRRGLCVDFFGGQ